MSLSIEEYAKFAEAAYSYDLTKNQELNGWIVLETNYGINGFQAIALGQDNDGDGLYDDVIIAYRGTNSGFDILVDDLQILIQDIPEQSIGACNFYEQVCRLG